jgi:hypothetical protein
MANTKEQDETFILDLIDCLSKNVLAREIMAKEDKRNLNELKRCLIGRKRGEIMVKVINKCAGKEIEVDQKDIDEAELIVPTKEELADDNKNL